MPRTTRVEKPDALLIADMHLREDQPVAWEDSYWDAQEAALDFLVVSALNYDCPIVVAGDVYHRWKPSPYLLAWTITKLREVEVLAIPGQHDLPQHNLDLYGKSGLCVLERAGCVKVLGEGQSHHLGTSAWALGFPFGVEYPDAVEEVPGERLMAIAHVLTYTGKRPFPGCSAPKAPALMKQLGWADIILTGDNHEPFVVEKAGRLLVNPGSMMRMTAAQMDHKPRAYLWYASQNTVTPLYIPQTGDLTREHIEDVNRRDERIEAFVERLEDEVEIGLSFEQNITEFMDKENTPKAVRDLVWEVVDMEG